MQGRKCSFMSLKYRDADAARLGADTHAFSERSGLGKCRQELGLEAQRHVSRKLRKLKSI